MNNTEPVKTLDIEIKDEEQNKFGLIISIIILLVILIVIFLLILMLIKHKKQKNGDGVKEPQLTFPQSEPSGNISSPDHDLFIEEEQLVENPSSSSGTRSDPHLDNSEFQKKEENYSTRLTPQN
jgi:hypothetical protein